VTIDNKRDMYLLYEAGAFGNKLRTWNVETFLRETHRPATVSMRYQDPGWKLTCYEVPASQVHLKVAEWISWGAKRDLIALNESAPDSRLTIQGELVQSEHFGYSFFYSTLKTKMRTAMQQGISLTGPYALTVAKSYMTGASADDIDLLLERYPGGVIEFSCYEMCLGSCPGRNTVIWEVRHGY
jgi:hypothetical protein